jgi:hypothetical protein
VADVKAGTAREVDRADGATDQRLGVADASQDRGLIVHHEERARGRVDHDPDTVAVHEVRVQTSCALPYGR